MLWRYTYCPVKPASETTNNQQPTTNNQQPTNNHQQPTTNSQPTSTRAAERQAGSGNRVAPQRATPEPRDATPCHSSWKKSLRQASRSLKSLPISQHRRSWKKASRRPRSLPKTTSPCCRPPWTRFGLWLRCAASNESKAACAPDPRQDCVSRPHPWANRGAPCGIPCATDHRGNHREDSDSQTRFRRAACGDPFATDHAPQPAPQDRIHDRIVEQIATLLVPKTTSKINVAIQLSLGSTAELVCVEQIVGTRAEVVFVAGHKRCCVLRHADARYSRFLGMCLFLSAVRVARVVGVGAISSTAMSTPSSRWRRTGSVSVADWRERRLGEGG